MTIKQFINQPFPYYGSKWKRDILFLSVFVSIFLLIFQPIEASLPHKQLILIGFGIVAFITGALLHLTLLRRFPNFFNAGSWTIKKHLLWFAIQLFFIGIANYFYAIYFIPSHPKGINGLILFQLRAFLLGVFPIAIDIIVTRNNLLTKNLKELAEINNKLAMQATYTKDDNIIRISSDNEKDSVEFYLSNLLFVESVGNYIQVYYSSNSDIKNTVLRCSLKRAEIALSNYDEVMKCHRAYIVNIRNVCCVKGNSLGYRLSFERCDKEIPVSRNYAKIVKEYLDSVDYS